MQLKPGEIRMLCVFVDFLVILSAVVHYGLFKKLFLHVCAQVW